MNILFLTMVSGLRNVSASGIYTDLMRKFRDEGHEVYIIYPKAEDSEKRLLIIDAQMMIVNKYGKEVEIKQITSK